jgi:23S rRNA (adenine-N6)-dimethyltransferase
MNKYSITQNFLKKSELVALLVKNAGFQPEDTILDIGSGKGIITQELAKYSKNIIAIEADSALAKQLRIKFQNTSVKIASESILEYKLPDKDFHVFANIPFNITANIVKKLLSKNSKLKSAYIIMQKEAAEKFAGSQIKGKSTVQSLLLGVNYKFEIIHKFSMFDFEPRPRVEVVMVKITHRTVPLIDTDNLASFYDFITYIFSNSKPYIQTCSRLFSFTQFKKFETNFKIPNNSFPSDVSFQTYKSLFEFMLKFDSEKVKVIKGAFHKITTEQNSLEKINRTRTDTNWKRKPQGESRERTTFSKKPNGRERHN